MPYRARVNERTLLNLPGFHGGAYVYVYVEDTSERGLQSGPDCACDSNCRQCPYNFEPHLELEIADCNRRISLDLDLDTEAGRENSLHKLDTLMSALSVLRAAFQEEFEPYDRRQQELEELRS